MADQTIKNTNWFTIRYNYKLLATYGVNMSYVRFRNELNLLPYHLCSSLIPVSYNLIYPQSKIRMKLVFFVLLKLLP